MDEFYYKTQVKVEGTSADRIAALTLSIRESSLANVSELEPLLTFMEKRKGSRELVARSMEALGELFRMYLLPDRKLKFFEQQLVHVSLIHSYFMPYCKQHPTSIVACVLKIMPKS